MEYIAIFAPLIGFLITGLGMRSLGTPGAQFITCASVVLAALASLFLIYDVIVLGNVHTLYVGSWISAGDFSADWSLRFDQLSVVMIAVVTIVSACVHIYSIGYMEHDHHQPRFFAYLNLFTFAMLMLVSADNLLQLFFGWEGVGLASYLLIGFWHHKPSANSAAIKAFIINRAGDFGLLLAIMTCFAVFGSIHFDQIFTMAPDMTGEHFDFVGWQVPLLELIAILLFIGAVGKSAQLGLHTWLPDAMEGPTPVSALIHAATMVTAGVFLLVRFSPVLEYAPVAMMAITVLGALTAFVAATIGLVQFDIKRVIAYSTMSQLGYMVFAIGVSAYSAAMFHLVTHAFFKALLFLGAGSVIHAMSEEQDMRRMGGIWREIPHSYAVMWIGSLALAGIPFFAGYYSKDMILEAAFADHTWFGAFAFWLGIAAALLTALYSWRLLFMTFHGQPRADDQVMAHIHESGAVMRWPLYVLALGAIVSGALLYGGFVGSAHDSATHGAYTGLQKEGHFAWNRQALWGDSIHVREGNDTLEAAHQVPKWVKLLPVGVALIGIFIAWVFYIRAPGMPGRLARWFSPVYYLFCYKWFFDWLYERLFRRPAYLLGHIFATLGDRMLIDGLGPDGMAALARAAGKGLSRLQSGYMYHYAFVMMAAVIAAVSWYSYTAGLWDQLIAIVWGGGP